jgi:hypothetical protein
MENHLEMVHLSIAMFDDTGYPAVDCPEELVQMQWSVYGPDSQDLESDAPRDVSF